MEEAKLVVNFVWNLDEKEDEEEKEEDENRCEIFVRMTNN